MTKDKLVETSSMILWVTLQTAWAILFLRAMFDAVAFGRYGPIGWMMVVTFGAFALIALSGVEKDG